MYKMEEDEADSVIALFHENVAEVNGTHLPGALASSITGLSAQVSSLSQIHQLTTPDP